MSPPIRTRNRRPPSRTVKLRLVIPPSMGSGSTRPDQIGNVAAIRAPSSGVTTRAPGGRDRGRRPGSSAARRSSRSGGERVAERERLARVARRAVFEADEAVIAGPLQPGQARLPVEAARSRARRGRGGRRDGRGRRGRAGPRAPARSPRPSSRRGRCRRRCGSPGRPTSSTMSSPSAVEERK